MRTDEIVKWAYVLRVTHGRPTYARVVQKHGARVCVSITSEIIGGADSVLAVQSLRWAGDLKKNKYLWVAINGRDSKVGKNL